MKIIPAIDLWQNQVVRLRQGDFSQITVYSKNPVEVAKEFYEKGITRLHVVDLEGAKIGMPCHRDLISKIKKETNLTLQVGGGIRSFAFVKDYFAQVLDPQKDFLVIGSLPIENPIEFEKILSKFLKNIILAVDVWGRQVKIQGWQKDVKKEIQSFIQEMYTMGVCDFLVTQIQRDGLLEGPDFLLYGEIIRYFPKVRFIASGGVRNKNDLIELKKLGLYGVILGKAYYEKSIRLEEVLDF